MAQIHYFLGAYSPTGFYSLYHELLPPERAETICILKGGPGCGKSSFMRRVARRAEAAGEECVFILCSADPDSLDGLILPRRGIALVDGTAPHVIEPAYPGVVEQYVDLGSYYRREGLLPLRQKILEATGEYKTHYKRVFHCLEASSQLRRDNREMLLSDAVREKCARRAAGIVRREIRAPGRERGEVTHRFLSATTYKGRVFLRESVSAQARRVYELSDSFGLAHELLTPILSAAAAAGWDAVACPDPMAPERLAHLIIPSLSLAFVSTTPDAPWEPRPYRRLRLDAMADAELLRLCRPRLRFSGKVAAALEDEAVAALGRAKAGHDRLEALYNPHVDFEAVYRRADALAEELLPSN